MALIQRHPRPGAAVEQVRVVVARGGVRTAGKETRGLRRFEVDRENPRINDMDARQRSAGMLLLIALHQHALLLLAQVRLIPPAVFLGRHISDAHRGARRP